MQLPVPSDATALLARLRADEREVRAVLAALEEQLRRFEDVERPAYTRWLRLELGPELAALDRRRQELRARQATVWRVQELVERAGWDAREALHVVLRPEDAATRRDRMDPDVVDARRRAKRERKRTDRKAARRAQRAAIPARDGRGPTARARCVDVYRAIARRLHPDSPDLARGLDPDRLQALWTDAHSAWVSSDLDRLLAIATWLDAAGALDAPPIVAASLGERVERLRRLARATRALERRIAALATDPAWGFSRCTPRNRHRLRADAARTLDGELRRLDAALAEAAALLDAIGSPRRPRRR